VGRLSELDHHLNLSHGDRPTANRPAVEQIVLPMIAGRGFPA